MEDISDVTGSTTDLHLTRQEKWRRGRTPCLTLHLNSSSCNFFACFVFKKENRDRRRSKRPVLTSSSVKTVSYGLVFWLETDDVEATVKAGAVAGGEISEGEEACCGGRVVVDFNLDLENQSGEKVKLGTDKTINAAVNIVGGCGLQQWWW